MSIYYVTSFDFPIFDLYVPWGRVIGLRFAVFGHFLCGYLRFRGFWAIFFAVLRFRENSCGFAVFGHIYMRCAVSGHSISGFAVSIHSICGFTD